MLWGRLPDRLRNAVGIASTALTTIELRVMYNFYVVKWQLAKRRCASLSAVKISFEEAARRVNRIFGMMLILALDGLDDAEAALNAQVDLRPFRYIRGLDQANIDLRAVHAADCGDQDCGDYVEAEERAVRATRRRAAPAAGRATTAATWRIYSKPVPQTLLWNRYQIL